MPNEEKNQSGRTEVRVVPDTVRTAGAETIRETDMGTVVPKQKKSVDLNSETGSVKIQPEIKKTVIKTKRVPDTVRTAGSEDIMGTDE
ncbi:MAG: hypothetical protein SFU91_07245 [Chloroherpetonaceae bacterium]|nr:hypothetical protein [Chloroherpetonaceae bacterium]